MTELNYGETIKVGDLVSVGKGLHPVSRTDSNFCYVRINKYSTIRLPIVYDEEFKNSDELDDTRYMVYHR